MSMRGKVCLITGATSGLGKATAHKLAGLGARVILVGQELERCSATASEIKQQTVNAEVDFFVCDLSSYEEIRIMTQHFRQHFDRLDILVNNAAAVFPQRLEAESGHEMTLAVNHLGPFLLTLRLLDVLRASHAARIFNITCHRLRQAKPDLDDLHYEKRPYNAHRAYQQTKLFNLLFTIQLAKRLTTSTTQVGAIELGTLNTELGLDAGWQGLMKRFRNATQGTAVDVAAETVTDILSSGDPLHLYYVNEQAARLPDIAAEDEIAQKLWTTSEELTGANETVILGGSLE